MSSLVALQTAGATVLGSNPASKSRITVISQCGKKNLGTKNVFLKFKNIYVNGSENIVPLGAIPEP